MIEWLFVPGVCFGRKLSLDNILKKKFLTIALKHSFEIELFSGSATIFSRLKQFLRLPFVNYIIREYSKLMAESRQQAMDRMIHRAEELNADAIVGVRFTTSMLQAGASEIFIYGTAVKL